MSIQDIDNIEEPKRKNKKKPLRGRDTRLVIDGNSVYELDQNCLKKVQDTEDKNLSKKPSKKRSKKQSES